MFLYEPCISRLFFIHILLVAVTAVVCRPQVTCVVMWDSGSVAVGHWTRDRAVASLTPAAALSGNNPGSR